MKINWFTLIAQILNFIILMWLLKRYLYKPILKAIQEREDKIKAQLRDAEEKKAEAKKERDEFNEKNKAFERQKEALMQKVIDQSHTEAAQLNEEVRAAANSLKDKLEKSLQEEQEIHQIEIAEKIQGEVLSIAKKTLSDLSSASLEDQIVLAFIMRVNELEEKQALISALNEDKNPILIQSAFDLSIEQQDVIKKTVLDLTDEDRSFEFKTTTDLIAGIELSTNGYKISWSIAAYIKSLEQEVHEVLEDNPEHVLKDK